MSGTPRHNKWQGAFPIFLLLVVASVVFLTIGPFVTIRVRSYLDRIAVMQRLQQVHSAMMTYAAANGGKYPDHVRKLIGPHAPAELFLDPRNRHAIPPTYSRGPRPGVAYRFGDFIFIYDPDHTASTSSAKERVVALSVLDFGTAYRLALLDSGDVAVIAPTVGPFRGDFLAGEHEARRAAGKPRIDIKDIEALDNPPTP